MFLFGSPITDPQLKLSHEPKIVTPRHEVDLYARSVLLGATLLQLT